MRKKIGGPSVGKIIYRGTLLEKKKITQPLSGTEKKASPCQGEKFDHFLTGLHEGEKDFRPYPLGKKLKEERMRPLKLFFERPHRGKDCGQNGSLGIKIHFEIPPTPSPADH